VPGVEADARPILARKANMRVVVADVAGFASGASHDLDVRSVLGAVLVQERDRVVEAAARWDGSEPHELCTVGDPACADRHGVAGAPVRLADLRAP